MAYGWFELKSLFIPQRTQRRTEVFCLNQDLEDLGIIGLLKQRRWIEQLAYHQTQTTIVILKSGVVGKRNRFLVSLMAYG
jgi:hypothetical protein